MASQIPLNNPIANWLFQLYKSRQSDLVPDEKMFDY